MFERRSKRWPIILGVVMIVLIVAVSVGWVLVSVFGALGDDERSLFYWIWLPVGAVMLAMILAGVVIYLTLSIKSINLNERQQNFIDSVTHELKSPIASLKLSLQTLRRRNVSAEERENFMKFMADDVERLDELFSNLLDVARLDRGEPGVGAEEEVPLDEILLACAEQARRRHQLGDELRLELHSSSVRITARRIDVEMLFRNLIDNAVKYAGSPPDVLVRTSVLEGRTQEFGTAVVEVCDNGKGVPPHLRRRIFGRFIRLGRELERETPGVGLGLHLVQLLVKRMKGRIRVLDREQGSGANFEVRLPCGIEPTS